MSRKLSRQSRNRSRRDSSNRNGRGGQPSTRLLRFESLEQRRLLAVYTVSSLGDAAVAAAGDAPGTLRQAIFDANQSPGSDTIEFQQGLLTNGGTILLSHGEFVIADSLLIFNDAGSGLLTIDASGNDVTPDTNNGDGSRIFNINYGDNNTLIDVDIRGFTMVGGDSAAGGGAIRSFENLTLSGVVIQDNHATSGGGIYSRFGNLSLTNVTIQNNTASLGNGGGISQALGDLALENTDLHNNRAFFGDGGGLHADFGDVTVNQSSITGNIALHGGGAWSRNGNLTITASDIGGNLAAYSVAGDMETGGGIYKRNNELTIIDSTITGNRADGHGGGVYTRAAKLTVTRSTFDQNSTIVDGKGGALYSADQNVTITESTISGNSAVDDGGGIFKSGGLLAILNSTIDANVAGELGNGGGLYVRDASLTAINSTLGRNYAGEDGGGLRMGPGATASISHTTITANVSNSDFGPNDFGGGGISVTPTGGVGNVAISNSIIAGNFKGDQSGVPINEDIEGHVTANYSLIGIDSGASISDLGGNLIGTADAIIDPRLRSLTNNGGPTRTYSLLPGSPAIDAGDPTLVAGIDGVPTFDQRGIVFSRVFDGDTTAGARVDIGAYETQALTFVVDTLVDESDGDFSVGDLALREAIEIANLAPERDTINFSPDLTINGPAVIVLTKGELKIINSVAINGPGAELLTIDASGNSPNPNFFGTGTRVFNIDNLNSAMLSDVNIADLTLKGGNVSGPGGAILSRETLNARDLVITGNRATLGGAIAFMIQGNSLSTLTNCELIGNMSTSDGGAVFVQMQGQFQSGGASLQLTGNLIENNMGTRGAGIFVAPQGSQQGNNLFITDNQIIGNKALSVGGGIFLQSTFAPKTVIRDSTISGNSATNRGAGIYISQARDVSIINSVVSNNALVTGGRGQLAGGGIYNNQGDIAITGSTISGNVGTAGGGIYSRNGDLAINFSVIENNVATSGNGGGILSNTDRFSLANSIVSGNSATSLSSQSGRGGGLSLTTSNQTPVSIVDTVFSNNAAISYGGGADLRTISEGSGAVVALTNVTVTGNTSNRGGGINFVLGGQSTVTTSLVLDGGSITGNNAVFNGGGIYGRATSLVVNSTTIAGNHAGLSGGGVGTMPITSLAMSLSFVDAKVNNNTAGPEVGQGLDNQSAGGGIWIPSGSVSLSLLDTEVIGNRSGRGGGIFRGTQTPAGGLTAINSTISGNTALRGGGGIYNLSGPLSLTRTSVVGNASTGTLPNLLGHGGGIFTRQSDVLLTSSTIMNNSTATGRGGGLYQMNGDLSVIGTTIAGNSARLDGGGVYAVTSTTLERINVTSSTVSGNSSLQRVGGLYLRGNTTIRHSTVTANASQGGSNSVGGLMVGDGSQQFELDHTIVAGNLNTANTPRDLRMFVNNPSITVRNSLIGDNNGTTLVPAPVGSPDLNGNLIGSSSLGGAVIDPLLGALTNNGGKTLTHALLPGSPALDAGALISGTPVGYDQRGNPFSRAADGTDDGMGGIEYRIDIGAYESQGLPSFAPGDYNRNGVVDAADYTTWADSRSAQPVTPGEGADGNGDGFISQDDYALWANHFGNILIVTPVTPGGGGSATGSSLELSREFSFPIDTSSRLNPRPAQVLARDSQSATAAYRTDVALLAWLTSSRTPDSAADTESGKAGEAISADSGNDAEAREAAFESLAYEFDFR